MVIMMATDPFSIESIQSRAPALSKSDFEFIQGNMKDLFPKVTDPAKREDILKGLLTTEELIPSLWILISDIRYLKQPAKILNMLLPPKPKKERKGNGATKNRLRERFRFHFTRVESSGGTIEVQQSTSSYISIPGNHLDPFDLAYQQIWLCSCRVWKNLNAYGLLQLATLAHQLGFSTVQIDDELKKDPGHAAIEKAAFEALTVLRPNEIFVFDANQARPVITSFKDYLTKMLGAPTNRVSPFITVEGSGEPLARRCGYGSTDIKDLNHLFLDKVHAPLQAYQKGGDEISSFYVKRSRHIAFFGAINLTGDQVDPNLDVAPVSIRTEQQITRAPSATIEPTGSAPSEPRSNDNSQSVEVNQTVLLDGRVVTFMQQDDDTTLEVSFERERVNQTALHYANQGKKLSLPQGGHFVWQRCFDILVREGCFTVLVSNAERPMPPINGKRRSDPDLPDELEPPLARDRFDFWGME
jgi:hypothetical protein